MRAHFPLRDAVRDFRATLRRSPAYRNRLIAALLLALASVWLFHDEPVGISAAIFALLVALAISRLWRERRTPAETRRAWGILGLSLLPLVMQTTTTALLFALAGVLVFSLLMTRSVPSLGHIGLRHIVKHLQHSPFSLVRDARRHGTANTLGTLASGIVSVEMTALLKTVGKVLLLLFVAWLFIILFAAANPLFASLLPNLRFDLAEVLDGLLSRLFLMAFTLAGVWGLLRRNATFRLNAMKAGGGAKGSAMRLPLPRFGNGLLWFTLLLFNAIFAVHVATDLLLELPAHLDAKGIPGFRYAEYAHDGAYALAAAAALAGLFVLVAMPDDPGAPRPSRSVLRLLYLWLAQTLLVAASALVRLGLYVSAYSLTHARVYGFVFIALVCLGVALVAWRVHAGRSTRWLVRTCVLAAIAVVWGLSVINLDKMIASYNIAHSREVTGRGAPLDVEYITKSLSVYALPAMFAENGPWRNDPERMKYAADRIEEHLSHYRGWRQWSWRAWRLRAFAQALRFTRAMIQSERRNGRTGGE